MMKRIILYCLLCFLANNLSAQDDPTNAVYYQASNLYKKGEFEIKSFNALYQEKRKLGFDKFITRSSYLSSYNSFLFGANKRFNYGFDVVLKSNVIENPIDNPRFSVFDFKQNEYYHLEGCTEERAESHPNSLCRIGGQLVDHDTLRNFDGDALLTKHQIGLSHFGPKIKFNPVKKWKNITLQQTVYIPIQRHVDGQTVSFTQLFYDKKLNEKNYLFAEVSFWTTVAPNFRALPLFKVFYSHLITPKWTVYAMTTIPIEYGLGTKYRIAPGLELEWLWTTYAPIERILGDREVGTLNFGVRYTNF